MSARTPVAGASVSSPSVPVGHHGTRAAVLRQLKQTGVATAATVGAALQCSLNAVRHHLKELEADGLVVHDRAHHGVGAPAHAFRLSPSGHALFPERYAGTLAHLLDHLVKLHGRDGPASMLQAHYAVLGARICAEAAELPQEARGAHIARALDAEGFMATWNPASGGGTLTEHNCPHRLVAERFPEVCAAEEAFLARAFDATIERQSHITSGCGSCSYHITTGGAMPEAAS
ncbi:MAG: helix-turn-helix transcriptional regulator [Gemmatimonadales bacterium]